MATRGICAWTWVVVGCVAAGGLLGGPSSLAGDSEQLGAGQTKLVTPLGQSGDSYGHTVASDGVRIAIGAPRLGAPTSAPGYVEVLLRSPSGPTHEGRVFGNPGAGDHFGFAVALDGDTLAVGAPYDIASTSPPGEVRIFRRSNGIWLHDQTLVPHDGANGDFFGGAVVQNGDVLIVGAPFHAVAGHSAAGAVYVYERADAGSPFTFSAKRVEYTPHSLARFGWALSSSGPLLAVGSPRSPVAGNFAGVVYLYERVGLGSWPLVSVLLGSDIQAGDRFGTSVALGENTLAVGAPHANAGRGKAYVFERALGGPWQQAAQLYVQPNSSNDLYGSAIGLSGGVVAVGAPGTDEAGEVDAGSVSTFQRVAGSWLPSERHVALDGMAGEAYGSALMLVASELLVGAPQASGPIPDSGAAYVHHVPLAEVGRGVCIGGNAVCPCGNGGGVGEGCRNGSGRGGSLQGSGSTSVSHGDLELHAHGLPPGSRALLFVGRGAAAGGQGTPFGDGLRCAQGALRRLGTALVAADGYVDLGPALATHPRWVAGDVRTFQVWYTDRLGLCGAGYNLTSGLEVAFTF